MYKEIVQFGNEFGVLESIMLPTANPVTIPAGKTIMEAAIADVTTKEVRAVYPFIKAINSGRLTLNNTFYPRETIKGGYSTFVKPYGKPIIREHRFQDSMGLLGPNLSAEKPMGRIIYAGYKARNEKVDGPATPHPLSKKGYPGTLEGDGYMVVIPAITNPESIPMVLGGAYHTVSIGSTCERIIESISQVDLIKAYKEKTEVPDYIKGEVYNGKLSFWSMFGMGGKEISYVNAPSDTQAGTMDSDIGLEGVRLLAGEKKQGSKEFAFFDILTGEAVSWQPDDFVFDESFALVDSIKLPKAYWANITESSKPLLINESVEHKMNIDTIKESLKDLSTWKEFTANLSDEDKTEIAKVVSDVTKDYKSTVEKMVAVEELPVTVENEELLQGCVDLATEVTGDWNEDASKLALASYLISEGKLEMIEDVQLTIGELYGLEKEDEDYSTEAKLSTKARNNLPDSAFCGPNRSFPVHDKAHAVAALRLIGRYKGGDKGKIEACIRRKAAKFGVGGGESVALCPITVEFGINSYHPYIIRNEEDLNALLESKDIVIENYNLNDEDKAKFEKFLETAKDSLKNLNEDAPLVNIDTFETIVLDNENVFKEFEAKEKKLRDYLLPLVAIARKLNLSKEEIEEFSNSYKVFVGTKALEALYNKLPEKKVQTESTPSVQVPNPGASTVTEKTEEAGETKTESKVFSPKKYLKKGGEKKPILNKVNK